MSRKPARIVMVGVDFDLCGDDAILEGVRMVSAGEAAELHAVHVLDPGEIIDHPSMPALVTEENALEQVPHILGERIRELARGAALSLPDGALKPHARIGKPAEVLLQASVDYDVDLLIVGTHARRGLDRLVLGSVAERLVRTATCPVLVARPKDHSGRAKTQLPDAPYPRGQEPKFAEPAVDRLSNRHEQPAEAPTGVRIV